MNIVGRYKEIKELEGLLKSGESEFLAVYGRRRVGKTYLVSEFFKEKKCLYFSATGKKNGSLHEQLRLFSNALEQYFFSDTGFRLNPPRDWLEAFKMLTEVIDKTNAKKTVIFLDELPWLASPKSGFLEAMDYYWNTVWSRDSKYKLVVCGSAASWMIKHIVDSKGGLHNRTTALIKLLPFKLHEVDAYLKSKNIILSQKQIADLYLCIGGIPHYLNHVLKGRSSAEIIDKLCFQQDGMLRDEFKKLYSSLFDNHIFHETIVRHIAKHPYGISRVELLKKAGITSGGGFNRRIEELIEAGFIVQFQPFHKESSTYFKVIDEYTLFYIKFIEHFSKRFPRDLDEIKGYWQTQIKTATYKSWSGLAFEALCYKHVAQIRKALELPSSALPSTWQFKTTKQKTMPGAQIDLLFDRQDGAITLCEMKYYEKELVLNKIMSENLKQKMDTFQRVLNSDFHLFMVVVTPVGLKENKYSHLISNVVILSHLFQKL